MICLKCITNFDLFGIVSIYIITDYYCIVNSNTIIMRSLIRSPGFIENQAGIIKFNAEIHNLFIFEFYYIDSRAKQ